MGETSMAKTERMEARGAKRWKIWVSGIFGQRRPVASHGGKRALQLGICAVVLSVPGILSLFWGAPVTATLTQGQDEVAQNHPQDHPQDLPEIQPRLTGSDCSFLEDPDAYEGLDGRHRIDLSRRTEEVTGELLMQAAATLVPAQGIPRRNFIDQHLFDKMARTTPAQCAATILKGLDKGERRILIGPDAVTLDRLQRASPSGYPDAIEFFEKRVEARRAKKRR